MLDFYRDKRIFVTGHTGFKGTWLCKLLTVAGAQVTGFAQPAEVPGLWWTADLEDKMRSILGDIRAMDALWDAFQGAQPEIVFHLAAQPLVREGYRDPVGTYGINVMGTVHILECIRRSSTVRSVLNVTTDKVYQNRHWPWGYRENDILDGSDPYANAKSCSELVTGCYQRSYLEKAGIGVSTARAGNVIGGGDFARDRIIPDCVRAVRSGEPVRLRHPHSVRPYQHVLEPLSAYLLIAQRQYEAPSLAGCYNVGPESGGCLTTGELADLFCQAWGDGARWECVEEPDAPHEDALLRLDCSKIHSTLGWRSRWNVQRAVSETVAWYKKWLSGEDMPAFMEKQIRSFLDN